MSYKTILACLTSDLAARQLLPAAIDLTARFDAHLIGLHTQEAIVPYPGIAMHIDDPRFASFNEAVAKEDAAIKAQFDTMTERKPMTAEWRSVPTQSVSASDEILKSVFRSDLVIASPPDRAHERADQFGIQKDLIVNGGAPVLLIPAAWAEQPIGKRIIVAWNATREASIAMRAALPFLRAADAVSILTIAAKRPHSVQDHEEGHEVARALSRHGVKPDVVHVEDDGGPIGARILSECERMDADLLVMGAYGHSRLHSYIFSDASSHILQHAELPVLLVR